MLSLVFRKTAAGKAEIGQRSAGLALAARQLLILVNGVDSVQVLQSKGRGEVRAQLDTLLALGLIESVPAVTAAARPKQAESAPAPAPEPAPAPSPAPVPAPAVVASQVEPVRATPPAPLPDGDDPQRLKILQRRAYQSLQPHFGPDTSSVAGELLAARTLAQYQAKLAIYMGRKQAEREVLALRS